MALLKYFRKIEPSIDEQVESILPKPHGSLSLMMPSSSIAAANCEVIKIMKSDKEKAARVVEESTIACLMLACATPTYKIQIYLLLRIAGALNSL